MALEVAHVANLNGLKTVKNPTIFKKQHLVVPIPKKLKSVAPVAGPLLISSCASCASTSAPGLLCGRHELGLRGRRVERLRSRWLNEGNTSEASTPSAISTTAEAAPIAAAKPAESTTSAKQSSSPLPVAESSPSFDHASAPASFGPCSRRAHRLGVFLALREDGQLVF